MSQNNTPKYTVAIVTELPRSLSVLRFQEEIISRGHYAITIDPRNALSINASAYIIRGGPNNVTSIGNILKIIEPMGAISTASSSGWLSARSRIKTAALLKNHSIPSAYTTTNYLEYLQNRQTPAVIKLNSSNQGLGVSIAESDRSLISMCETLNALKAEYIIQEYIDLERKTDDRYFVVGDRIAAAMQRTAKNGDFRSNISIGGSARPVPIDPKKAKLALRATRAFGLGVAGIDFIDSRDGPIVLEMNPSPGLGIEKVTGVNVAGIVVDWLIAQIR